MAAGIAPLSGCATTTWTLTGECLGPEVESEEYDAYALFLREAMPRESIVVERHTLAQEPVAESELADLSKAQRQRFREFEEEQSLRYFGKDGPAWRQAVASYNERSRDGGGCLARLPRRMSEPVRGGGDPTKVTFSRVGFDSAKTAAIFKVELRGATGSCNAGRIIRLVKTPDEGWMVLDTPDWITDGGLGARANLALAGRRTGLVH